MRVDVVARWVLALAIVGGGASPVPVAAGTHRTPGVDPADAAEMVETLVGLEPARYDSTLAAMHGRAALYSRYRAAATAGDQVGMRVYLLLAFVAVARVDAATMESFSSDVLPLYRAQADTLLAALRANPWLTDTICYFLGHGFEFEGRDPADRPAFIGAESDRIRSALHKRHAARCFDQIEQPHRPAP